MKSFTYISLLLLFVGSLQPAYAIVYINRVLNPTPENPCNYVLNAHVVQGSELWNDDYQNAYGECEELEPGPPFVLEGQLRVIGGDLTVQGGTLIANWQIYIDSSHTFRIVNTDLQLSPSVNVLANAGGIFEADGATISVEGTGGAVSINFGSVGELHNCTLITPTTHFLYSFAPNRLVMDNCTINCGSGPVSSFASVWVSANQDTELVSVTNCDFSTNADEQRYLYITSSPTARIAGNHFGPATGYGIRVGNISDLVVDNNHFQDILCAGAINADCGPAILNNSAIRSVRGNTGSGCTFNGVRMAFAGAIRSAGAGRMRSEEGFPFVLNTAMIIDQNDSLIFEPGTVMKLGGFDNMIINGHLKATETIFTSERDTEVEGNTTQLFDPSPGDWRGMIIDGQAGATASGWFKDCTFRYGAHAIRRNPNAQLTLDGCLVEYADGEAIELFDAAETEPNTFALIKNSTIRFNIVGVYDFQRFPTNWTELSKNRIFANRRGLELRSTNDFYGEGNFVAGNREDGFHFMNSGGSPSVINNITAANGRDGIYIASGTGGEGAHILNNHVVGNRRHGLSLNNWGGQLLPVSNNLLAYNRGYGSGEFSSFVADHPLRHNAFWANGAGAAWENNATLLSPDGLNQEPGSAQNISLDPALFLVEDGAVVSAQVLPDVYQTEVVLPFSDLEIDEWRELLFWNRDSNTFYLILSNTEDRLLLADTSSAIVAGTDFAIVDIERSPAPSPLANLGENIALLPPEDYLGAPRIQQDTVDIGALESEDLLNAIPEIPIAADDWTVFPNPAIDRIHLKAAVPRSPDANLILYDAKGNMIWRRAWAETVILGDLPSGMYWLVSDSRGRASRQALVIQR